MNTYYEHIQDNKSGLQLSDYGNFVYPSHFHHKIELFILKSGEMTVSCNGSVYNLTGNSVAFFNSYDVHEYLSQSENLVGFCVIIPPAYAMRFAERNKNKKVKNPVIVSEKLCNDLYFLAQNHLQNEESEVVINNCLELMLSLIEKNLTFVNGATDNETDALVKKVLMYINDNLKGDVSLKTISKKLGYSDAHLSRVFKKYVKRSLPSYVNELRYNNVTELLKRSNGNITELAIEGGFNSLQTYYRYKNKYENK